MQLEELRGSAEESLLKIKVPALSIIPKPIPHIPLEQVRDVPVQSRFAQVWQRARLKIKSRLLLKYILEDRVLFGAHILSYFESSSQAALTKAIRDKLEAAKQPAALQTKLWLIYPESYWNFVWNCFCSLLVLLTVLVLPVRLAFLDRDESKWWYLDIVTDVVFFCDILKSLNTGYVVEEGAVETSRWEIAKMYGRTWLLLDVIACLPMYQILEGVENEGNQTEPTSSDILRLFRFPRFYRLFQVSRVFKFFHQLRDPHLSDRLHSLLSLSTRSSKVLIYLLSMVLVIHLVACCWFLVARAEGFPADSWVCRLGVIDMSPGDQYTVSLYWTVVTLSTVGYGDVVPGTRIERVIAACWMLFTILFVSFTVGSMSASLGVLNSKGNVLATKLAAIDEFGTQAGISKDLTRRLKGAVKYSSLHQASTQRLKRSIFSELPKALKFDVAVEMHQGAAKAISFFVEKDKAFVVAIVPFLKHAFCAEMEWVYREKDYADEVYFVVKGGCYIMVTPQNAIRKLPHNTYFGEYEVIRQLPRKFSILAYLNTDLLVLGRQLLRKIQLDFPAVYREMEKVAIARNLLNEKAKRTVLRLIYLAKRGVQSGRIDTSQPVSRPLTPQEQEIRLGSVKITVPAAGVRFDPASSFETLRLATVRVEKEAKGLKGSLERLLEVLETKENVYEVWC